MRIREIRAEANSEGQAFYFFGEGSLWVLHIVQVMRIYLLHLNTGLREETEHLLWLSSAFACKFGKEGLLAFQGRWS